MFMKNRALIEPDAKIILDSRNKILREYGELQQNGDIIIAKAEVDEVQKKLDELMDIDLDVALVQVPVDEFEELQLSLEDIDGLRPLIMDFEYTSSPIYKETEE